MKRKNKKIEEKENDKKIEGQYGHFIFLSIIRNCFTTTAFGSLVDLLVELKQKKSTPPVRRSYTNEA